MALCADEMDGRAAGSAGGQRAIDFLARRFAALGLEPVVGGNLVQTFSVPDPLPPAVGAGSECRWSCGSAETELLLGNAWSPLPFSPHGHLAAELVFAGHGLVIPSLGLDDYRGLDLHGRIAVVLRGGPRWRDPDAPVRAQMALLSFRSKAELAVARGAVGLVLVDRTDSGGGELQVDLVRRTVGDAALPFVWVARTAAEPWFGPGGIAAAQRALDDGGRPPALVTGSRLCLDFTLERRAPLATGNVLGILKATPGAVDGDCVVVGAHHDHIGRGEFGSLGQGTEIGRVHPGADDNASGVAAVLHLATRLAAAPIRRRAVVFAAFGAEELGQAGSCWFLDHLPAGVAIAAMLDLDMIGRGQTGGLTIYGAGTGDGVEAVVRRAVLGVPDLQVRLRERSTYRSDQSAFLARRIPALLFTTGLHDAYHRPGDVPERLEYAAALQVVDVAAAVLDELLAGPRPRFHGDQK